MRQNSGYLDIKSATEYTSLSRRTLDYAKENGELPFIRKGRKIVFKVADLEAWMDRDRIDVTDAVARIEDDANDRSKVRS